LAADGVNPFARQPWSVGFLRAPHLWTLTAAATFALAIWCKAAWANAPTPMHRFVPLLVPMAALVWWWIHPRSRDISALREEYGADNLIQADPTTARRLHDVIADRWLQGQLGAPFLCACAAGALWHEWMMQVGAARWFLGRGYDPPPLRIWALRLTLGAFVGAWWIMASCERVRRCEGLASPRLGRLDAAYDVLMAMAWSGLRLFMSALFSLTFGILALCFAALLWIGVMSIIGYEIPSRVMDVLSRAEVRSEVLVLAVPGMLARAWSEWREAVRLASMRLTLLARELANLG